MTSLRLSQTEAQFLDLGIIPGAKLHLKQDVGRPLGSGKYKVEAKLKPEGNNPPVSVRGTLSLTPRDAVVQPRLLVRK